MTSTCKLCERQRELRKSHILPESMYRPMFDSDSDSRASAISSVDGKLKRIQSGAWERLLCDCCEQHFNREFDDPFNRHWRTPGRIPSVIGRAYVELSGIDYDVTKGFALSVIWRAHVASRGHLSEVDIRPYDEKIRDILYPKYQGGLREAEFPIFCRALRDLDPNIRHPKDPQSGLAYQAAIPPFESLIQGHRSFVFVCLGCAWQVFLAGSPFSESLQLKQSGALVMPVVNFRDFLQETGFRKESTSGQP